MMILLTAIFVWCLFGGPTIEDPSQNWKDKYLQK